MPNCANQVARPLQSTILFRTLFLEPPVTEDGFCSSLYSVLTAALNMCKHCVLLARLLSGRTCQACSCPYNTALRGYSRRVLHPIHVQKILSHLTLLHAKPTTPHPSGAASSSAPSAYPLCLTCQGPSPHTSPAKSQWSSPATPRETLPQSASTLSLSTSLR